MFSGIVESVGTLLSTTKINTNIRLHIACPFLEELKVDQSIAHNGLCLTVSKIDNLGYYVDVIMESLNKSNLGDLKVGDRINLERSLRLNDRVDGHMVQGHIDQKAELRKISDQNGSWLLRFRFINAPLHSIVSKGSICLNGVSLTLASVETDEFSVCIIPYTYEHTNLGSLLPGNQVNVEFDVIGKYVEKLIGRQNIA